MLYGLFFITTALCAYPSIASVPDGRLQEETASYLEGSLGLAING